MFKVSIYVPSVSEGEHISYAHRGLVIDRVCHDLSINFGGFTMVEAEGGYVMSTGELVQEHNTIIYSFADFPGVPNAVIEVLRELGTYVKESLNQESVLITVEPVTQVEFI